MKPVYRVAGILLTIMGSEEMFTYRAFWQFTLTVLVTLSGLVLFGANYE